MPFTGQLGTPNSRFGNIALGVSLGLGTEPFSFLAHVLTSDQIRILFTRKVMEGTALSPSNYLLTSLAPPGTALIPAISSVKFFDETRRSTVLILEEPLTYSTDYSVQVDGVMSDEGESMVLVARNFTANVQDPPRVLGAWQSKRGAVDVLFDRSVGPTSGSATFEIRDASLPGPGVPMAQLAWASEGIPETTLRLSLPGGTPTASAFEIDFIGVTDGSLNGASGTVSLTLALRSPPPWSLADLLQLQLTDASVIGVSSYYPAYGIVRVYFNGPVLDAAVTGNWAAFQEGAHLADASGGAVTAPNAVLLPSLLTLLADFKAKFNAHLVEGGIHLRDDAGNAITLPDPVDQATATPFINAAQLSLLAHFGALRVHLYKDEVNTFNPLTVIPGQPNELAFCAAIANNYLKGKFNAHLAYEFPITQFVTVWGGTLNPVEEWASYGTIRHHETRGPHTLFADLHLLLKAYSASVRLEATLTSEDGFSATTPADFTGSIVARAASSAPSQLSALVEADRAVEVLFDRDMVLPVPGSITVPDSDGRPAGLGTASLTSTLPDLQRALKHAMNAYRYHIYVTGAGHQILDTANHVGVSDTPLFPTLQALIWSANKFKGVLTDHMANYGGEWHQHPDPNLVRTGDAYDLRTAAALIDDIIRTLLRHDGGSQFNGQAPHWKPGARVFNAAYLTVLRVEAPSMLDGAGHEVVGNVRGTYYENHAEGELGVVSPPLITYPIPVGERKFCDLALSVPFTGVATRPSLASAVPRSGLVLRDDGVRFESDMVEAYFSKPMRQVELGPSNLALSGGSTLQKGATWTDERTAAIQVVNMTAVPHALTASGLTDEAGNAVY